MVVRLGTGDRDAVVELLVSAFCGYPVMTFVLGSAGADPDDAHLRALIGYYVDRRLRRSWPVLGVRCSGELRAVALISEPLEPDTPDPTEELAALRARIGGDAFVRMQRFEAASDAGEPPGPHLFVGMLGVEPAWQGRGLGRVLLETVAGSAAARGYHGVYLTTEDLANLSFYERTGFTVIGCTDVDQLRTWSLIQPIP